METIVSDTSMRDILDYVDPDTLRNVFIDCIRPLRRGKILEKMLFMGTRAISSISMGTRIISTPKIFNSSGLAGKKGPKDGEISLLFFSRAGLGGQAFCTTPGFSKGPWWNPPLVIPGGGFPKSRDGATKNGLRAVMPSEKIENYAMITPT